MTTMPDWHQRWLDSTRALDGRTIFFIVGCQKSGTTWVQRLLNAHPQVVCYGEGHLCDAFAPLLELVIKQYNQLQSRTGRLEPAMLFDDDDLHGFLKLAGDRLLLRYLLNQVESPAERAAVRAIGDKTPEHAIAIDALRRWYPKAKFIHIIRDGRDGAVSGWAHLQRDGGQSQFDSFASYAQYFAERHWKPYITKARTAGGAIGDDYLEVRYEALLENPKHQTSRMLELLEIDLHDEAVQQCVDASSFAALTGGRASGDENRASHFRKGVSGDWRTHFDADALTRFESAAGDLLRELDYEPATVTV